MSATELQIIAQDARGLKNEDRQRLCEIAFELDTAWQQVIQLERERGSLLKLIDTLEHQNSAQAERIRELTTPRPTVYGQFLLVTLRAAHVPSWMKFDWCK